MWYTFVIPYFFKNTMDDQNQTNPQAGAAPAGGQPAGDTSLPWMNFSADPTASDASQPAGSGTPAAGGATGSFDPFGNPFAAGNTDNVAAAFAPSPTDGSMPAPATDAFVPSEPTAFTPAPESAPAPAVTDTAIPSWTPPADTSSTTSSSSSSASAGDSMDMLHDMKDKFEEEEEEFNRQINEHKMNIEFEEKEMKKLREERSKRLSQMRELVRGLDDMLGMSKKPENNNRPQEQRSDARRDEQPRKADRVPNKPKGNSGVNDFLAA